MKTIRRKTKRYEEILNTVKAATVKTLHNNFQGELLDGPKIGEYLRKRMENSRNVKMREDDNGTIEIHVHSNCWYVLHFEEVAPEAAEETTEATPEEINAELLKAIKGLASAVKDAADAGRKPEIDHRYVAALAAIKVAETKDMRYLQTEATVKAPAATPRQGGFTKDTVDMIDTTTGRAWLDSGHAIMVGEFQHPQYGVVIVVDVPMMQCENAPLYGTYFFKKETRTGQAGRGEVMDKGKASLRIYDKMATEVYYGFNLKLALAGMDEEVLNTIEQALDKATAERTSR